MKEEESSQRTRSSAWESVGLPGYVIGDDWGSVGGRLTEDVFWGSMVAIEAGAPTSVKGRVSEVKHISKSIRQRLELATANYQASQAIPNRNTAR